MANTSVDIQKNNNKGERIGLHLNMRTQVDKLVIVAQEK